MRTESWSQTQLELAAEAILAELEGRERRTQQERYLSEETDAEQLLRVIAAAAVQAVEKRRGEETVSEAEKRTVGIAADDAAAESGVQASGLESQEDWDLHLQRQVRSPDASSAVMGDAVPELRQQRIPFGGRQQTLHTISDWIERESRRYDGGFTIF